MLRGGASARGAWAEILRCCAAPGPDPSKAWDRFPLPFSKDGKTTRNSVTVFDCLEGLQAARDLGWLKYETFDKEAWSISRKRFDASWVIPGRLLGIGEPILTAENPAHPGLMRRPSGISLDSATKNGTLDKMGPMDTPSTITPKSTDGSPDGTPTDPFPQDAFVHAKIQRVPEKILTADGSFMKSDAEQMAEECFVEFLRRCGVGRVVRLNFQAETKRAQTYEEVFHPAGLTFGNFEFTDGKTPSEELLAKILEDLSTWEHRCGGQGPVVALHCKAGLGRTGVVAAAFATSLFNISGPAFHGWIRMCRPGTIQTAEQELFVRKLRPAAATSVAVKQPASCMGLACLFAGRR